MNLLKCFWRDEKGLGTVELVILVAVLVAVALIFGKQIKQIVTDLLSQVSGNAGDAINQIGQ